MLPDALKVHLESDYKMKIMEVKYLSKGSNGSVCKVTNEKGEFFCIKAISKSNPSAQEESQISPIMYDTDHFKVRIYADELSFYVVTPFFVGDNLAKMITENNISLGQREAVFAKLIISVEAMHKKGILHRDLKAENIIVNLDGDITVTIIDFGRSVRVFDDKTGKALATPKDLSLISTNNAWYSFFPLTQLFRRWQPQTAPEYTSMVSNYNNYIYEAEGVGFRSDYYAIANLFSQLLPEHPEYKEMINLVQVSEGLDRTHAYHDFAEKFLNRLNMRVSFAVLPFFESLESERVDIAGAADAPRM